MLMACKYVFRHDRSWDYVILEILIRVWLRNSSQHPKEIIPVVPFGFFANTACFAAWHKGLHLNVYKPSSIEITAQYVGIGRVAQCYNGRVAATA